MSERMKKQSYIPIAGMIICGIGFVFFLAIYLERGGYLTWLK